jgi:hypothetical protein
MEREGGSYLLKIRIEIRVRPSPDTGRLGDLIAIHAQGAAVGTYPRGIWQEIDGKDQLRFERHRPHDVFTKTYLAGLPDPFSHWAPP